MITGSLPLSYPDVAFMKHKTLLKSLSKYSVIIVDYSVYKRNEPSERVKMGR